RRRRRIGWQAMAIVPHEIPPPRASSLAPVPTTAPAKTPRRPQNRPAAVLRPACPSRRAKGLRGLFGAVAQDRVVPLLKVTLRRTGGGARLSVALSPPHRHRQQPAHRLRRERRHLQVQGLSRRRP